MARNLHAALSAEERFWLRVKRYTDPCWLWSARPERYGQLGTGQPEKPEILAHRMSWEIHYGVIPPGLCVLHHCDTPACVNPRHLFLGTKGDNFRDAVAKGRHRPHRMPGELHPRAKLTRAQVNEIRSLYGELSGRRKRPGLPTTKELAGQFGVSPSAISHVVMGHTWDQGD